MQAMHSFLRCRDANDGRMSGLCPLTVGTDGLTHGRHIAGDIQQVILDLKRKSDRTGVMIQARIESPLEIGGALGRHQDTGANDGSGFPGVHILDLGNVEHSTADGQIDGLSAGHPEGPTGFGQQIDQP